MEVTCACGVTFTARNRRAKFCSDRCRKRAQRGGSVVPMGVLGTSVQGSGARESAGAVERAATVELEAAGRLDTMLGQVCLTLARRLDTPGLDTGSAVSATSKELAARMIEATKGAGAATAPQSARDELAARRASQGA